MLTMHHVDLLDLQLVTHNQLLHRTGKRSKVCPAHTVGNTPPKRAEESALDAEWLCVNRTLSRQNTFGWSRFSQTATMLPVDVAVYGGGILGTGITGPPCSACPVTLQSSLPHNVRELWTKSEESIAVA